MCPIFLLWEQVSWYRGQCDVIEFYTWVGPELQAAICVRGSAMNTNFGSLQSHISKMNLKMNLIFKILPSLILYRGWDCPFSQNSRVEQEQRQCLSPSISSPPISAPLLSQTAHQIYFLVAFRLILELMVGKSRTTWDLVWVVQFTETPVTCDDLFPESPWRQELSRRRSLEGSVHCPCRPLWGQLDLLEILVGGSVHHLELTADAVN